MFVHLHTASTLACNWEWMNEFPYFNIVFWFMVSLQSVIWRWTTNNSRFYLRFSTVWLLPLVHLWKQVCEKACIVQNVAFVSFKNLLKFLPACIAILFHEARLKWGKSPWEAACHHTQYLKPAMYGVKNATGAGEWPVTSRSWCSFDPEASRPPCFSICRTIWTIFFSFIVVNIFMVRGGFVFFLCFFCRCRRCCLIITIQPAALLVASQR